MNALNLKLITSIQLIEFGINNFIYKINIFLINIKMKVSINNNAILKRYFL